MASINVLGSMNMDVMVRTSRVPIAGETLYGSSTQMIPGGKGANQAVAAARAGVATAMFGCLGSDNFASVLLDSLNQSEVDCTGIELIEGFSSGTAIVMVEENGQNRIIIISGANEQVNTHFIERHKDQILDCGLLILQNEIPAATRKEIINTAYQAQIPIMVNPAPFLPLSLEEIQKISYLVLNETEASLLTGIGVSDLSSATKALDMIAALGVKKGVITLGSNGSIALNGEDIIHQSAFKVHAVDTTAAGDTFVGFLAAELARGNHFEESLKIATAASALAVTRIGAQTSIPTIEETIRFLECEVI